MFGFEKDLTDDTYHRKFGAVTIRSISITEKPKRHIPFMIGVETEFFRKHLPITFMQKVLKPFDGVIFKFNKFLLVLMLVLSIAFIAVVYSVPINKGASDIQPITVLPVAFFASIILGLILHEAGHAAIMEKIYQEKFQKTALASAGIMIVPIFPIMALVFSMWFGWNFWNIFGWVIIGGAYVRPADSKELFDKLLTPMEKIRVLVAGVFTNTLIAAVSLVALVAMYILNGFSIVFFSYDQVILAEFFLYNVIINLTLVWFNIIPMEIGSDGFHIWKNLGILMPKVNRYASWVPIILSAAMIFYLGMWFMK
jgi:Zn-dependent protease